MKIKKLVRVIAKSDFMNVDTTMISSKATGFVNKIKKIHTLQLDTLRVERRIEYLKGSYIKSRILRELPEGVNSKIKLTIEPAGEILD